MRKLKSYLYKFVVCAVLCFAGSTTILGAGISLEPDSVNITTGIGTEFDLELNVDASTQGIRLFQVFIKFDTTLVDTVSTALGPLFNDAPYQSVFNSYIYYDSTLATVVLRLEGLLFGPSAVVDGPGTVAIVRLVTLDSGFVDLSILDHTMTDINNDPISSTASGAKILINFPFPFELISPEYGEEIHGFPGYDLNIIWHECLSFDPSEIIEYTCELSSSASFTPESTFTFTGISDTSYSIPFYSLTLNHSYWFRVKAHGTTYNWVQTSTPSSQSFYLKEPYHPMPFFLLLPGSESDAYGVPNGYLSFTWGSSFDPYPEEDLLYDLECSNSIYFEPENTIKLMGLPDTTGDVPLNYLDTGIVYWRVEAYGDIYGMRQVSTPSPDSFFFYLGAEPGEFDLLLPTDDSYENIYEATNVTFDWEDAPSLIPDDTTRYIISMSLDPAMTLGTEIYVDTVEALSTISIPTNEVPPVEWLYWHVLAKNKVDLSRWSTSTFRTMFFVRGNVDAIGEINVSDLTYLVAYLFTGGSAPYPLISGDLDCSGTEPNVADLTFLVSFLFTGGVGPTCP